MEHHGTSLLLPAAIVLPLGLPPTAVTAENIDPSDAGSQYAYSENVGWLNAEPSGNGGPGVQVTDFELTGWTWGENVGWISLRARTGRRAARSITA